MNKIIWLSGTLDLEEFDLMKMSARDHEHQPHPSFKWVWIYQLKEETLPINVREIIQRFKWESLQIFSVIIENHDGIPEHQHVDECEMYFGGDRFATMFTHNPWEDRKEIQMNWRNYSVVIPGGKHGIITDITTKIFAVKFRTSAFPPPQ